MTIEGCLKTLADLHEMFLFVEGIKEEGDDDDSGDHLSDLSL